MFAIYYGIINAKKNAFFSSSKLFIVNVRPFFSAVEFQLKAHEDKEPKLADYINKIVTIPKIKNEA